MSERSTEQLPWSTIVCNPSESIYWRFGRLQVWLTRLQSEWQVAYQDEPSFDVGQIEGHPEYLEAVSNNATLERMAALNSAETIIVSPQVADRPVVFRPEHRFTLPSKSHVTFYVSSPIWVRLTTSQGGQILFDQPTLRPSDTWFGPSPRSGELCYASRTRAASQYLPNTVPSTRLITQLSVYNTGGSALSLERLKVPLPHLTLFLGADGVLWTSAVELHLAGSDKEIEVRIDNAAPQAAGDSVQISQPRQSVAGVLKRAFHALVG